MPRSLRADLTELTTAFFVAVVNALRDARLEELQTLAEGLGASAERRPPVRRGSRRDRGRPPTARWGPELEQMVALLRSHPDGMRAEDVRAALGLTRAGMQRLVRQGVATRVLASTGRLRATRYFAR